MAVQAQERGLRADKDIMSDLDVPAAGWHPDPHNPAEDRYFDGAVWTPLTRQRGVQPPVCGPSISDDSDEMPGTMLVMKPVVVFKALLGLALFLLFVTSALALFMMRTPGNMTATTAGTVTSVRVSAPSRSRLFIPSAPSCIPVAEFMVDRTTYRASMLVGTSPCPWAVGQRVTVAYNPTHPSQAMIPAAGWTKYRPWILTGSYALLAFGTLFFFVRSLVRRLHRS